MKQLFKGTEIQVTDFASKIDSDPSTELYMNGLQFTVYPWGSNADMMKVQAIIASKDVKNLQPLNASI